MTESDANGPEPTDETDRKGRRRSDRLSGTVDIQFGQQGRRYRVKVLDLSRHGVRLSTSQVLRTSDICWVTLPGLQPFSARVSWVDGFIIGCEFDSPLHPAVFDHLLTQVSFGEVIDRRTTRGTETE